MKKLIFCFIFQSVFSAISASSFNSTIQQDSLLHFANRVNSQFGEEGIIDHIMDVIGIQEGFLVEFGGFDGIAMANTRLLAERGWEGAFIEPHPERFIAMRKNFAHLPKILTLNDLVTPFEHDQNGRTIDGVASHYFPGKEIDVMSIDIDGLDHLILKNMLLRPKLIIIEGGDVLAPTNGIASPR